MAASFNPPVPVSLLKGRLNLGYKAKLLIMKINSNIQIIGSNVVLVPYRKSHVEKYHKWMEDETLRQETSSEKLTLAEEFANQQSWLHDENKCTFIVLSKEVMNMGQNEVDAMIGDANLYLRKADTLTAEIGLMIAEKRHRGKGLGLETLFCLIRYGVETLKIDKFIAVISLRNTISLNLFLKLNFTKTSLSAVFNEITLEKKVTPDLINLIRENSLNYTIAPTVPNQ